MKPLPSRRSILKGLSLGAGASVLGPLLSRVAAQSEGRPLPLRFVFLLQSNGMNPAHILPSGVAPRKGDRTFGNDATIEVPLADRELPDPIAELAPFKDRLTLIQGLFQDTLQLDEPVALAHLDGDWYESTMTCLTRIAPLLVPGGRIVLTTPNYPMKRLFDLRAAVRQRSLARLRDDPTHVSPLTAGRLERLLRPRFDLVRFEGTAIPGQGHFAWLGTLRQSRAGRRLANKLFALGVRP